MLNPTHVGDVMSAASSYRSIDGLGTEITDMLMRLPRHDMSDLSTVLPYEVAELHAAMVALRDAFWIFESAAAQVSLECEQ